MNKLIYVQGTELDLDLIAPLWQKLNQVHYDVATHFKSVFNNRLWKDRKKHLKDKALALMVEYVLNENDVLIAYCISSIDREDHSIGEIDSIYVEESYRKSGIGKVLMQNGIDWLVNNGTKTQKLVVAAGNEQVMNFYQELGFYPRSILMQRVEKGSVG